MNYRLIKIILVILSIVVISSASIFSNKFYILAYNIVLLPILFNRGFLKVKFYLPIIWLLVNILVIYSFSLNVEYLRFSTSIITLFLFPYFILAICRESYWVLFEKTVFYLSVFSLIIFPLNILFPGFFDYLFTFFRGITDDKFYMFFGQETYWTSLIYVHMDDTYYGLFRNAGFMWEPGAFAWMIILALSIRILRNGIKFDKFLVVYTIALLTTLSTSGYIAILVLFSGAIASKQKFSYLFTLILLLIIVVPYLYEVDFVGGEINAYVESYEEDFTDFTSSGFGAAKLDRFLFAKYQLIEVLKYPFGFGIYKPSDIDSMWNFVGVNGLSDLLFMWGVVGFILIIYSLWRFFKVVSNKRHSNMLYLALFIGNLMMIFSNPAATNPIVYFMIFTPLMEFFQKRNNINIGYK